MAAHGGPFDVTLDFGYRVEQTDAPTIEARVVMSWEHAMTMARILNRLVEDYEKQIPSLAAMRMRLIQAEADLKAAHEAAKES